MTITPEPDRPDVVPSGDPLEDPELQPDPDDVPEPGPDLTAATAT